MSDPETRSGGSTRLLALLGDPVGHSLSPVMQNAACRAAGVDGVYVALRCTTPDLPGLLVGITRAGGAGNVTLPHKGDAAGLLDHATDAVRRTGACNTFWLEEGRIHGDNTDVEGFRRALERAVQEPHVGMRVLLVGAGGAARAVLVALLDQGVREVTVWNRSEERARSMVRRIGDERVRVTEGREGRPQGPFDLVVNATSVGLHPEDPAPVDLERIGRVGAVMDIVYGARPTRLLNDAERLGIPGSDGMEMLLHQGAAAFERWWRRPAPLEEMRRALLTKAGRG